MLASYFARFVLLAQIVLGGVQLKMRANHYELVEVRVVLVGRAGIGDVKAPQRLKLHKVMAEQVLQVILFLLVRLLLLLFDLLQIFSVRLLLYAERVMSGMFQPLLAEVTFVVGVYIICFWPLRLAKNALIKLHVVDWSAVTSIRGRLECTRKRLLPKKELLG